MCFMGCIWTSYWRHQNLRDTWWRHQMETFSALLAICAGNSPVPVNSLQKGQWRWALMFSFICVWINDWVNNREAGDLRRHRGHYDVNVMTPSHSLLWPECQPLGFDIKLTHEMSTMPGQQHLFPTAEQFFLKQSKFFELEIAHPWWSIRIMSK